MPNTQDPFELDKRALDSKLKLLQENLDRWRRVKSDAGELTSQEKLMEAEDEFNWLSEEIIKSVKSIGWDLDDLSETLRRISEQQRRPTEEVVKRAEYIRGARDLLMIIDAEVKKSTVEASAAATAEAPNAGLQKLPQQQQNLRMSASTERLVESLLQQDDEDDDVELIIRDEARGTAGGRSQFSVVIRQDPASVLGRLWRNHRPVVLFVGVVFLLLLIIFIVSVASSSHQHGVTSAPTRTTPPSG